MEMDGKGLPMKKLLIIEGEAEVRRICREVAQAAGFDCFEAADGVTGCEIFFDERPDLVLLDPFVPRMDGRKILARIAEEREGRRVLKVLLATHADTPADLPPGIEDFGVVAVVPKPFDERLFAQSFHDLLEGTLPIAQQESTGEVTEGSNHAVGAPEATGEEIASHHAAAAPVTDRKEEMPNRRERTIPFAPGGEKPAQLDIGIPEERLAFEPGQGEIVTTDLRKAPRLNASDIEILDILNHSLAESKPENLEDPIDEIFEEITAFTKKPSQGSGGQEEEKRPEKATVEQGSIVPFFLPRLLARLYREKRGGIVTLSREGISKTIHLEAGCIRHVESTLPGEMLDTILLRMEV
ncbi:MAG: response regulator, partial [Deltaproteobacteria bacterium]